MLAALAAHLKTLKEALDGGVPATPGPDRLTLGACADALEDAGDPDPDLRRGLRYCAAHGRAPFWRREANPAYDYPSHWRWWRNSSHYHCDDLPAAVFDRLSTPPPLGRWGVRSLSRRYLRLEDALRAAGVAVKGTPFEVPPDALASCGESFDFESNYDNVTFLSAVADWLEECGALAPAEFFRWALAKGRVPLKSVDRRPYHYSADWSVSWDWFPHGFDHNYLAAVLPPPAYPLSVTKPPSPPYGMAVYQNHPTATSAWLTAAGRWGQLSPAARAELWGWEGPAGG